MPMREFTWVESPGTAEKPEALVVSTQFGDGYAQAAPTGINEIRDVYDVVFNGVDEAISDEIVAFLRDGLGYKPFDWVPPRRTVASRFICTTYQRTMGSVVGEYNISATFKQDFAP
jgi:phage-related protein